MDIHSIYIHIPFCSRKCDYCNFFSVAIEDNYNYARYIDSLLKELASFALDPAKIKTCYIGGGSPSVLPRKELLRLINGVLRITGDIKEFSVEVNPSQVDSDDLRAIRAAGVNRLSIGAQSFFDDELALLTRSYLSETITKTFNNARDADFSNISLDMIFALPNQSLDRWSENLDRAIELSPTHISAYSLSYETGTRFLEKLNNLEFIRADEGLEREMYDLSISKLVSAGFEQYEISNFAKHDYRCNHNLSYWYNRNYIGLGAGASSSYNRKRIDNVCDINRYMQLIEAGKVAFQNVISVSDKDFLSESAILMLRLREGIDKKLFLELTGEDVYDIFGPAIRTHICNGNLIDADGHIFLSDSSLAIGDTIFCDFSSI